ncbi:MAG: hypothetical protein IKL10_11045 [Clostridia bacterium]|nr:hypothetical protein [Clostridia bacterium]
MLGKLTKNTFKANMSSVSNVYLAMGIIGIIMLALLVIDWTKWGDTGIGLGLVIKIISSAALCITAGLGIIMTIAGIVSEYQRNMFGAEGHLTMSLPVRSSTLLLSKWIAGSFWVVLSYLVLCLCAFGSFIYIIRHSVNIVQGNDMYYSVYELVIEMIEQLSYSAGIATPSMAVLLSLASIYAFDGAVRLIVFVLLIFFAITLSNCRPFHKTGKFGKILYFFLGFFAVSTFAGMITKFIKIYIIISETAYTFTLSQAEVAAAWDLGFGAYSITNLYCTAIAAVFVFLITTVLIDRRVNVS